MAASVAFGDWNWKPSYASLLAGGSAEPPVARMARTARFEWAGHDPTAAQLDILRASGGRRPQEPPEKRARVPYKEFEDFVRGNRQSDDVHLDYIEDGLEVRRGQAGLVKSSAGRSSSSHLRPAEKSDLKKKEFFKPRQV